MRTPIAAPWWSAYRTVGDADVLHVDLAPHARNEAAAAALLDDAEHRRAGRFLYPGPRRRFILLRAALRSLLCDRIGCDNDALAFRAAEHGKPYAVVHGEPASVQFNVSDSGAHGLIGLAPAGRLGIDVEERSARRDIDGLIDTVFGLDERAAVASAAGAQRIERFYRLWTVKEALLKALGTGLYLDVAGFQAPAALLRGESGAEFRFPHLPTVAWWVEDVSTGDFAAAIAHEIVASSASPGAEDNAQRRVRTMPLALSLSKGIPASPPAEADAQPRVRARLAATRGKTATL